MRPSDHPDFFRLPPPPGRSRESDLRLDAQGRFWQGSQPVEHPGMQRAFLRWIGRHPDDGRFILNNGYDWTYFTVEDTPFLVVSTRPEAAGRVLHLNDGTQEVLSGAVWLGSEGALRTEVKGGRFAARFTPAAQAGLGEAVVQDGSGWAIQSGRDRIPVRLGPPRPEA